MINRLRRWLYRRIEGVPTTPLSVLGGPCTIYDLRILEELRGGFSGEGWGHSPFDHDSVQLAADFSGPEETWPNEYTHLVPHDEAAFEGFTTVPTPYHRWSWRDEDPKLKPELYPQKILQPLDSKVTSREQEIGAAYWPVTYTDEGWKQRQSASAHSYDNPRCKTSVSTILSKYPCDSEVAGDINLRLYYGVKDGEQKHRRDERLYPGFGFGSDITSWVTALNLSVWDLVK